MAQYKVPQDVEADDKLLGPFSFRQFVYLMICGGLIATSVGLFQLLPVLAIIPVPFILVFGAIALPLKKDQPMETYMAALVSYYLKPHTRKWTPGQRESTIQITVPKKIEETRAREITGEEATHRLSFLADIVDTEGYAIKGAGASPMRDDLYAEANAVADMFETQHFTNLGSAIERDESERHAEVVKEMQEAITEADKAFGGGGVANSSTFVGQVPVGAVPSTPVAPPPRAAPVSAGAGVGVNRGAMAVGTNVVAGAANVAKPGVPVQNVVPAYKGNILSSSAVVAPGSPVVTEPVEKSNRRLVYKSAEKTKTKAVKPSIMELAHNSDFSVATIEKEANRIKRKDEGEVFISLH